MARIDFVPWDFGRLGLTCCPGLDGDLDGDLDDLRAERTDLLVSLLTDSGWYDPTLADMLAGAARRGITVVRHPIRDRDVPASSAAFSELVDAVVAAIRGGRTVVVHCYAGLGRSGTLAACVGVRCGLPAQVAIDSVRRGRPGAIETATQESFVAGFV